MPYNTTYALTVKQGDPFLLPEFISSNEEASYCLDENGVSKQAGRWYEHEIDLQNFTHEHPGTLFELTGEGEDAGDLWKKYFKDGKIQKCKTTISFEEYDEAKLKK